MVRSRHVGQLTLAGRAHGCEELPVDRIRAVEPLDLEKVTVVPRVVGLREVLRRLGVYEIVTEYGNQPIVAPKVGQGPPESVSSVADALAPGVDPHLFPTCEPGVDDLLLGAGEFGRRLDHDLATARAAGLVIIVCNWCPCAKRDLIADVGHGRGDEPPSLLPSIGVARSDSVFPVRVPRNPLGNALRGSSPPKPRRRDTDTPGHRRPALAAVLPEELCNAHQHVLLWIRRPGRTLVNESLPVHQKSDCWQVLGRRSFGRNDVSYPINVSNKRSSRTGGAVETTASFPSPAQDYYLGPVSLDRQLVRRPASTFMLRVTSEALASMGIRTGDELIVDRALSPKPGRVLVVLVDGELRLGHMGLVGGRAALVTDEEELLLRADDEPWGVATVLIHHLPLGPTGERSIRREAG